MISITVVGDRNNETKRRRYGQFAKKLPKDVAKSLQGRLKTAIVGVALRRGLIGSTGAVVKKGNWDVRAKQTGDYKWTINATNVKAPYVGYLNRPTSNYPFKINLRDLQSWMSKKSKKSANWNNVRALARQIAEKGHISKKGKGFFREAVDQTLNNYPPIFRKIVRDNLK